jgi:hypothetical protein
MKNPYAKHDVVYIPEGLLTPFDDLVVLGVADDVRQDVIYSLGGQPLSITKQEKSNVQRLKDVSINVEGPADAGRLKSIPIVPLKLVEFNVRGVKGALLAEDSDMSMLDIKKIFAFTTDENNIKALEKIVFYVNEKNDLLSAQEDIALNVISKRLSSLSGVEDIQPSPIQKMSF